MIPRALTEVFNIIQTKNDVEKTIISVSFLEIYNEKVYDLLSENNSEQINTKGTVKFYLFIIIIRYIKNVCNIFFIF